MHVEGAEVRGESKVGRSLHAKEERTTSPKQNCAVQSPHNFAQSCIVRPCRKQGVQKVGRMPDG